mmetsp:Transcript_51834/g.71932  ORF Transcript_51834/g.71932 Transcript_51834/m.71932 type:complete len:206 (-) Transcript_51834:359-976(-)
MSHPEQELGKLVPGQLLSTSDLKSFGLFRPGHVALGVDVANLGLREVFVQDVNAFMTEKAGRGPLADTKHANIFRYRAPVVAIFRGELAVERHHPPVLPKQGVLHHLALLFRREEVPQELGTKYLPVVFKACAEHPLVLDQTGTWIDAIVWGWQLILRDQSDLRELELVLCHLGDGRLLRCELSIIGIIHRAPTRAWLLPELFLE